MGSGPMFISDFEPAPSRTDGASLESAELHPTTEMAQVAEAAQAEDVSAPNPQLSTELAYGQASVVLATDSQQPPDK